MGLVVSSERPGDAVVIRLHGDFDLYTSADVRGSVEGLLVEGGNDVYLDMSGVEFLDSSGLGTLVGLQKLANRASVTLALRGLRPQADKLVDVTSLREAFTILSEVPPQDPPSQAAQPGGRD